ncbi:CPBP family intramembrane glutamic endopeptidase [Spiroplasma cantharicola]|uniref:CAAX amino terminal membrane bound protease n=1 Tax=Spiroplasma cantharicola TaxID=362837 RepID=A0A0M4KDV1_9MOLU|nr:CPBP family intramembrane glutamic endopeptidase [Spiroplasma cantharicola]ALD66020.1 CAAX amino terminal membrane bound protease [Spiroplasma cantharicola]
MKEKITKLRDKHFNLSEETKFRFDLLNYKTDGMIFLTSVLIVPFVLSLFVSYFGYNNNEVFALLYLVSVIVGMVFNMLRNGPGFFKGGYFWIYLLIIGPQIVFIFTGLLMSLFNSSLNNDPKLISAFSSIITMILTEVIIIILAIIYDRKIFKRFKETLKTKWKEVIVIAVAGTIILYFVSTFIFLNLIETKLMGASESENQKNLIGILRDSDKSITIAYVILLFILTVVVAPFCEELCLRNSFNLNASNRWLGFVGSAMFFGFVHYGPTFDFGHILSYSAAGFILSGIFLFTKGNMTFSWIVHLLNNLLAFILILIII